MAKYEFAIFIENDLILAPDFLWFFRSTAPLLERDPSLWCVSSWNDNGFGEIVGDERRLFRTDYFPGLGWMIRNLERRSKVFGFCYVLFVFVLSFCWFSLFFKGCRVSLEVLFLFRRFRGLNMLLFLLG